MRIRLSRHLTFLRARCGHGMWRRFPTPSLERNHEQHHVLESGRDFIKRSRSRSK